MNNKIISFQFSCYYLFPLLNFCWFFFGGYIGSTLIFWFSLWGQRVPWSLQSALFRVHELLLVGFWQLSVSYSTSGILGDPICFILCLLSTTEMWCQALYCIKMCCQVCQCRVTLYLNTHAFHNVLSILTTMYHTCVIYFTCTN